MCDEIDLVVQAILEDNPEEDVEVIDNGAYVRVQAPMFMRVTLESLRRHLGRTFEMRQLESIMPAFAGCIETTSDEVRWQFSSKELRAAAKDGAA
jgi:toluene monooxygenase system protein D